MSVSLVYKFRWRIAIVLIAIALLVAMLPVMATMSHAQNSAKQPGFSITYRGHSYPLLTTATPPPTDAYCRAHLGHPCYSPQEMQTAYGASGMLSQGDNGKGQTIIIVDSFGSPTIAHDLKVFDAGYGLPNPPSLTVYSPLGTKPFNPNNSTMVSWAFETTLDVEWAHAMAPGARIALMTSPTSETQGVQGMPQFLFLEQWALDHNIGNIISQSWATTENTLFNNYPGGIQVLKSFNAFYKQAAADHVTVFGSSGDSGVANPNLKGKNYPFPTVNFPASDPYVTAVGGTSLTADTQGNYQSEVGWNGSGGGVSQYFKEPDYELQNLNSSDQGILKGYRGLPDISYNADPSTTILVYLSFLGKSSAGYYGIGGTSEGSPQWAGLTADGNQMNGKPLGFINGDLYQIANSSQYGTTYHDITVGNNSSGGITGYNATTGWDPVTGWGSPNATALFTAIIQNRHHA
ncbi:MAG TPA: S53 family peptidase [Ktedonobacteraceae bacterium]|nr:S53 family peptidase [Ktedonobacteraceae bacterium]